MLKYLLSLILSVTFVLPLASSEPKPFTNFSAFALAQSLPHSGELREKKGYYYVKVDDRYINDIFPLFTQSKLQKPPYFRSHNAPGAHISVFYEDETKHLGTITELGSTFSFQLNRFVSVHVKNKKLYLMQVIAPQLEALRSKYGLKPKLHGHEFHITIAVHKEKKKSKTITQE